MSLDFTSGQIKINPTVGTTINFPADSSSSSFTLLAPYANIERQLERIANALEKLADDGSRECTICHRLSHFYTDMPYDTDLDGELVCADCLQRALDMLRGKS